MVLSFLTVYVVTFSCFTLLLGKSFAAVPAASLEVSPRQMFKREQKTNASETKGTKTLGGRIKAVHSPYDPFHSKGLSEEAVGSLRESRSYFARFDPVKNATWKVYRSRKKARRQHKEKNLGRGHPWEREKVRNFIAWDILEDSEKEMRVHFNGITAKETVVMTGVDEETGKRQGLKLRQLTDGHRFIQLIYNLNDIIHDCEYLKEQTTVDKFLKTFMKDVEMAKMTHDLENPPKTETAWKNPKPDDDDDDDDYMEDDEGGIERYPWQDPLEDDHLEDDDDPADPLVPTYRNVTFKIIREKTDLPPELREWMDYSSLKGKCRENHRLLKDLAYGRRHGNEEERRMAEEHIERVKRSFHISLIYPGTKWCGKSSSADRYTDLGRYFKVDKCCRAHDHCHPLIKAFQSKFGHFNFRPFTISHCKCDSRRKRDIMDVLLVPGTKWCGKGRRATRYTSLGGFTRTDKCCRVHDTMCPHWIGSMQEKYGLFNWRINTIMHCRCDKRFRACLKMAKTGTANFVGKLFFNVVQTKCFVLKPKEVCLKYSWWGKCEKKEYRKQAYLKNNLSY